MQRMSTTVGMNPPWKAGENNRCRTAGRRRIKLVRVDLSSRALRGEFPQSRARSRAASPTRLEENSLDARPRQSRAELRLKERRRSTALHGTIGESCRVVVPASAALMRASTVYREKPAISSSRTRYGAAGPEGYFVTEDIAAGDKVVTAAAGQLLARESNSGASRSSYDAGNRHAVRASLRRVTALTILALVLDAGALRSPWMCFPSSSHRRSIPDRGPGFAPQQSRTGHQQVENAVNGATGSRRCVPNRYPDSPWLRSHSRMAVDVHIANGREFPSAVELGSALPVGVGRRSSRRWSRAPWICSRSVFCPQGRCVYPARYADWIIKPRLLAVPGVAHVNVFAVPSADPDSARRSQSWRASMSPSLICRMPPVPLYHCEARVHRHRRSTNSPEVADSRAGCERDQSGRGCRSQQYAHLGARLSRK